VTLTRYQRSLAALTLVLGAGVFVAGDAVASRYRVAYDGQATRCLPWTWYFVDLTDRELERGDLVAFRSRQAAPHFPRDTPFIKRVAGIAGDRVRLDEGKLLINDTLAARQHPDIMGRVPTAVRSADYIVPPGALIVLGDTHDSFDSRYWGPIAHDQVSGQARGLW
jgi:conjugal transfer pilin signal peptidase TrbI